MDTLSRLLDLARPQASLDLRCLLSGAFDVDHAPMEAGIAPFHLVLEGECVIETADGGPVPLRAGDFVLFPRGTAHRVRDTKRGTSTAPLVTGHDGLLPIKSNHAAAAGQPPAGELLNGADLDLLCGRFVYTPGSSALLLNALPDPFRVSLGGAHALGPLQALIGLMRDEAGQRRPGALAIVTALSQALFTMALRVHGDEAGSAPGMLALLADARLAASVQGMLAAPERPWTIAELGELAAMSRATYARRFNERAGMTVMDFLTQIRMTIACDLLRRTQRSAAEVGEAVGYQSEAAFGKAFQQHVGVTPGRYRRLPHNGAPAAAA
ncbi:AraC family transcriptional regulator [Paraburkholderia phenoliruptrix]|uniref:AraC family transcriptional regulator n=1 Tax=Paraburkholderia phenoliruptrix TaxID=252970 RepID=UPI001C6E6485|nr:AraC family transcriptional regulator [Paraburkholderia phenoliruptrix]MBW9102265.1 AraC family transcriptional regulator [Paraburkholderia phenoliruptrix]MBW9127485.1 AraC family transcriptional regulator [Paraburkholderia ginsengiterrae]